MRYKTPRMFIYALIFFFAIISLWHHDSAAKDVCLPLVVNYPILDALAGCRTYRFPLAVVCARRLFSKRKFV